MIVLYDFDFLNLVQCPGMPSRWSILHQGTGQYLGVREILMGILQGSPPYGLSQSSEFSGDSSNGFII